jgi:hypothetical protein
MPRSARHGPAAPTRSVAGHLARAERGVGRHHVQAGVVLSTVLKTPTVGRGPGCKSRLGFHPRQPGAQARVLKPKFWLFLRSGSKRSGSLNRFGSRFPEATRRTMMAPLGMRTRVMSMSIDGKSVSHMAETDHTDTIDVEFAGSLPVSQRFRSLSLLSGRSGHEVPHWQKSG